MQPQGTSAAMIPTAAASGTRTMMAIAMSARRTSITGSVLRVGARCACTPFTVARRVTKGGEGGHHAALTCPRSAVARSYVVARLGLVYRTRPALNWSRSWRFASAPSIAPTRSR